MHFPKNTKIVDEPQTRIGNLQLIVFTIPPPPSANFQFLVQGRRALPLQTRKSVNCSNLESGRRATKTHGDRARQSWWGRSQFKITRTSIFHFFSLVKLKSIVK